MNIHLISTGGAIMHNLAIALHKAGHQVTGSDDEIYDPARSRLEAEGLLPDKMGWYESNIHRDLDLCILGMHARANNPELSKALELEIPVYSFPEYVYMASKEKERVVIAGSHGKTTTTSIILHVLNELERPMDYLVGAQLDGFDEMVRLSDAPVLIAEGDEYLSSAIDRRPKFIHYKAHVAVITGIAWDHMNVFKTFDIYLKLFKDLLLSMPTGGKVFYYEDDDHIVSLLSIREDLEYIPYNQFPHQVNGSDWGLIGAEGKLHPVRLIGEHNMQNISAAWHVCQHMGIPLADFLNSLASFQGASKRLQPIREKDGHVLYQDFAHAPSKVKATTQAVKASYPNHRLVACAELHTYSSLSKEFLPQYDQALAEADEAIVFYQEHTLEMKKLPQLEEKFIKDCFGQEELKVITDSGDLKNILKSLSDDQPTVYLMMSSGTFGGLELKELANDLIG